VGYSHMAAGKSEVWVLDRGAKPRVAPVSAAATQSDPTQAI